VPEDPGQELRGLVVDLAEWLRYQRRLGRLGEPEQTQPQPWPKEQAPVVKGFPTLA